MKNLIKQELKNWFPNIKGINSGMIESVENMFLEYVNNKGEVTDPELELAKFLDDKYLDVECELESWD